MAAPATVDDFLELVRKSGVADEKRLEAYLQKARGSLPAGPAKTAEALIGAGVITAFQAEHLLAGKWRRFNIGKYKVLERLGAGGMGQVYLCEHKLMRRRVAVKVLPTAKAKDSSALDRFYREARAVAALTHPNIVHAYDIDQDEDLHFLVMEYVDGANLQDIIKKSGALDVTRACHYIRDSALALQHAHESGLVHRDVKPGNILVDRGGVVKILDLGLARFFHDEDDCLTKKYDESVLGTADYLSPEQALDSHAADIRADIYSLGATFYFLLTGRPPFESANIAQKLMMHQFKEPPPVQEFRKDVPAVVLAIMQKMMAKDVAQRYAIPGDVADALAPYTQDAIGPPPDTEMPHLSPAATGNYAALSAPETTVSKGNTPLSAPRPVPPATSVPAKASGATPAPRPQKPASNPRMNPAFAVAAAPAAPAAKAAPAVEDAPELAPWEQDAPATDDPTARADTKPSSSKSKTKKKPPRNVQAWVAVVVSIIVVVSLVVVGLTAVLVLAFYSPTKPEEQQPALLGPPKLEVSKDPTRHPGAYRSVQLALRNAKMGAVIELCDEVHEENLVVTPTKGMTSVTLQASPGKQILWRAAKPSDPIIQIQKAGDFRLKGKGITLDGTLPADKAPRKLNDLMAITFDCTGLIVEDLNFKCFARTAVVVTNANGSAAYPIKLTRLTTITEKSEKPRSAIYFDANPKVSPAKNDNIEVTDCEFRGIDLRNAIQFKDGTLNKNVRWPGR